MRLSQLTTLAIVGVTFGTGVVLGVPYAFNPNLPAIAQVDFENNPENNFDTRDEFTPSEDNELSPSRSNEVAPTPKTRADEFIPDSGRKRKIGRQDRRRLLREMNLSPDQLARLREVQQRYKGQLRERKEEAQQARQELRSLQANSASTDTLRSKAQEVRRLQKALREIRSQRLMAMKGILTPDQRQQLDETMAKRGPRMPRERQAPPMDRGENSI